VKRGRGAREALPQRLRRHLESREWWNRDAPVVVAFSGGMDSLVLLHLLRFTPGLGRLELLAAHFDHGMRVGSSDDAAWAQGLCRAWGVPLHRGASETPPSREAEARTLRYRFLESVRKAVGGGVVLTAHHADDEVETLLFRLLRGTGPDGLQGIPEWREPGVGRPLLPFRRQELEGYAGACALRPREDPSNRSLAFARNRIRHQLLPLLETIHPGAWRALRRGAELAAERSRAMAYLLQPHLDAVVEEGEAATLRFHRDRFLDHPPEVQAELLRRLVDSLGTRLSRRATTSALAFMGRSTSGKSVELSGGIRLSRDFEWLILDRHGTRDLGPGSGLSSSGETVVGHPGGGGDHPALHLSADGVPADGSLRLGRRTYQVSWRAGGTPPERGETRTGPGVDATLTLSVGESPLELRGRRPGDRVRMPGGTRRLKRLIGELRIPRGEREELPLLVDRGGAVVWIPGRWRSPALDPGAGTNTWTIGVRDDGDDT
jgi:tRNA(Ile)-lysidine synthase